MYISIHSGDQSPSELSEYIKYIVKRNFESWYESHYQFSTSNSYFTCMHNILTKESSIKKSLLLPKHFPPCLINEVPKDTFNRF